MRTTMKRFGIAVVCACLTAFVFAERPVKAMDACSDSMDLIQLLGTEFSSASSAYNNLWSLVEYQLGNGSMQVGDDGWNNSMNLLDGFDATMDSTAFLIENESDYMRSIGCPM